MDGRLPAVHLKLLEICRETTELVTLSLWNLHPSSWKFVFFLFQLQVCFDWLTRLSVAICFCPPLLRCCCWNEGPDRKGFLLSSNFRKTSLELLFDLTDSVKWSLNSFAKRFSSLISSNSTLFFNCVLLPEESKRSIECCTFDGTKSNYLFDQVSKWFLLEDLEARQEIKEERRTSWHFQTITMLWIRDPSRRESFSVFLPESHR